MQTTKHQKHAKLARPAAGHFGRREWAFMGAPCGGIHELFADLVRELSPRYRLACMDADHHSQPEESGWLSGGANAVYTNKLEYHRLDRHDEPNAFQYREWFNDADAVLVNGNHFTAARQVLILDPRKFDSLSRKLDRLTQVDLVLELPEEHPVPQAVLDHLGDRLKDIPRLRLDDRSGIARWLSAQLESAIAPVKGLILAGGQSTRMGTDKSLLDYHGVPQRDYLYNMMDNLGLEPVLSVAAGQEIPGFRTIQDTFLGLGPMGAILSAFREEPDTAWLVLACDLPLVDEQVLRVLIGNRRPSAAATAFRSPESGFPEPLAAIWEPRSYPVLFRFLSQGYSCPRKTLINSDTHVIDPPTPESMLNANKPEEMEAILKHYVGR
ncbi:MAG: NTP transferase domain-containing protein [Lewinellaceae bacterium]|nr:NTP transferase domain-containing protein [Lewinella sp.]MCB9278755.1 NTP transferase domain-containing protein [Lewinellaceae bacterium]